MDAAAINDVSYFEPHVGESFRIEFEPNKHVSATLVEATGTGNSPAAGFRAPFSLLFEVEQDVEFPQRIYQVEQDKLGTLSLFLVQVGQRRFETIFN